MNVNDVTEVPKVEDKLKAIFARQMELFEKYVDIEGMPRQVPYHVDLADSQIWFKDFLWRVTEELMESHEAFLEGDEVHTIEELSDALHFLIELFILVGIEPETITTHHLTTEGDLLEIHYEAAKITSPPNFNTLLAYFQVVYFLGLAGNCLKNKKWKKSQLETDKAKFTNNLTDAYYCLLRLFGSFGIDAEGIYTMYFKKSEVNKFRQRSKY